MRRTGRLLPILAAANACASSPAPDDFDAADRLAKRHVKSSAGKEYYRSRVASEFPAALLPIMEKCSQDLD
jgi:hypothetical protein